MFSRLTFLLAIGFAASISLPTGLYKYESQILTRAPRGDLTAAGLRFTADVVIAPNDKPDEFLVYFKHVHLSSLNGINPASSWSKIIYDEYWTLHKDGPCQGDLCSLTKPFLLRTKGGVAQEIVADRDELQLSINMKKGFAWEYQKLLLQENKVYQQLPTHYGYCNLETVLKSNSTSKQFGKQIKKINIVPVRGSCTQYPTNTDSIINEVKSTAEVMEGRVYNLFTEQRIQLRISKVDKTEFITQVNQTLAYRGKETGVLPPLSVEISHELVPTIDEDKIGGEKFVEKVFDILLSFKKDLTTDHGTASLNLLHLLKNADEASLMKLYTKVKQQGGNYTTLFSFLSISESCEANEVLFTAMEEKFIPLTILPDILEKQFQNTQNCVDLISRLKDIIKRQIWVDTVMEEKAYIVMSTLPNRFPEFLPEVWPVVEQLVEGNPILSLKMAGNLGHVMKLSPIIKTRELKIAALETLRHSAESDIPLALTQSFKMFANCSEHDEIRMLALKTYLQLSPINETWAEIKIVQRKNCSANIRSYIEDMLAVTANKNFPVEKPWAKKACDLKSMLILLSTEKQYLDMNVSRAIRLPFYCEKSNMGIAFQAEIIHSSNSIDLPEDRTTLIILKVDTYLLDKKMEPLEVQLTMPTDILKRIFQFKLGPISEMVEEIDDILSEIQIRIFVLTTEYSSLPNVQEAVRRVYERYLALQKSGVNDVMVPINTIYRLPTSVGMVLTKQFTVFLIARAYSTLVTNPLQYVLESVPIVLATAEMKVSVENAYMSLKTGSRVDVWNDLRVLKTGASVSENHVHIVKKLSGWQDKTIFYATVTPITKLQVFRPTGYFVSFNSLSVQTPSKRNYIKHLIGLRKPEVFIDASGYIEAESLVKPWTSLFREQHLMVDMHFKQGSDEDLVIDLRWAREALSAKTLGESIISQSLNVSVSRGQEESKVLVNVTQNINLIVSVLSNITLLSITDAAIWEGKFEIEVPSYLQPECLFDRKYLVNQIQNKPRRSLSSNYICNQTKYPSSSARLLELIHFTSSLEEMLINYDHMFTEIMPEYNFNDILNWQPVYLLVRNMKVLSEKVKQLKMTITANCSAEEKQVVLQVLKELELAKIKLEDILKEPVEESDPITLIMKRELVVNWLVQKYSGILYHIYAKVNRSEELRNQTLADYRKFVAETIPLWQDKQKRMNAVILKASEQVSVDLKALVLETSDYMDICFKIMLNSNTTDTVVSYYKILIKKMVEITYLIQRRSLGSDVNPYLWIRSQSMVVLQNVADINVFMLNQKPLIKSLSQNVQSSRKFTLKLYFTTLYLQKIWNATRYIQNITTYEKISDLANKTLETIFSMQDVEMYTKLAFVDIVNIDSIITASRKVLISSEKVLDLLGELDVSSVEDPLAYVSLFDILSVQYHAYITVKNVAKTVFKIVFSDLNNKNLHKIIKIQEKLDSCCEKLPSKDFALKDISQSLACPANQRFQVIGNIRWPTHNLTLHLHSNLTKSWEQTLWESQQSLPMGKSAITYQWLDDVPHKTSSITRLQVARRLNSYEEFQVEVYVKKGEIPASWLESATKAFDKLHISLFPYFSLKAVSLEAPVVKDSCRGVCLQGAVSERTSLVNAVFRLPRTIYTSSVPLNVFDPIKMKTCLY